MASKTSLASLGLRQIDRSFWCLHDHLGRFALLSLPTLLAVLFLTMILAILNRSYDYDAVFGFALWGVALPTASLMIVTLAPLPCGVFAWSLANGEEKSVGECFALLSEKFGRVVWIGGVLGFFYLIWFLLLGLPMLVFWPRTCMAPFVALFENERRIFRRSRRLMKEDNVIYMLVALHLLFAIALIVLIAIPRMLFSTSVFKTETIRAVQENIWIFELLSGAMLLCALATSWCVSLTLLYHDLRNRREGEWLKRKIDVLDAKYGNAGRAVQ